MRERRPDGRATDSRRRRVTVALRAARPKPRRPQVPVDNYGGRVEHAAEAVHSLFTHLWRDTGQLTVTPPLTCGNVFHRCGQKKVSYNFRPWSDHVRLAGTADAARRAVIHNRPELCTGRRSITGTRRGSQ